MRTALNVLLYIVAIALIFVNLFVFNDRLEQAKQEAYSEGYEAGYAALDLEQRESGKTYIDGYVKGLAEGKEEGMAIVSSAIKNPDSLSSWIVLNNLGIDYP